MAKKYLHGFTLIEVIMAVAIVAILAILVIGTFTRQIVKGNDAKRKANLDRIKVAVEEYEKDKNCYPLTVTCPTDAGIGSYLKNVPCDPVTGTPYFYEPEPLKTCPSWFRMYAGLQNTDDPSLLPGIGPGGAYNYYVSSPNASIPVPQAPFDFYACTGGVCRSIEWDPIKGARCDPNYQNVSDCYGDCPTSEDCVPQW